MALFSLPIVADAVAKASVILALAALAAASLRRASASARHFVWTLGLLSALAVPMLTIALPRWELPIVRLTVPADAPAPAVARTDNADATVKAPALARRHAEQAQPAPATTSGSLRAARGLSLPALPPWRTLALLVWAAGASLILARMLLGLIVVRWMSRRTAAVVGAPWLAQARTLAGQLGLRDVRFLRGAAGTMPMAWGIFRSSVLMPQDADTWPPHRLRVVLLHELAHVKRRDCLTHLMAQIVCAAYWFNPLAWMAARRLRAERERACDDLVLAAGTRGSDYADQLLDIARVMRAGRFPAVLAGASLAMAQRSQLEGRLMAILDPSVPRSGLTRARAAAAALVFTVVMVAVASVQPWAEEQAPAVAVVAAEQTPSPNAANRPIESYPGQAAADDRKNAASQDTIQDAVQGAVQGIVQGAVQGHVQGKLHGLQGIERGVPGGVPGGVVGGVVGGVIGGVVGGVVDSVTNGVVTAVTDAVHSGVAGNVAGSVAGGIANGMAGVAHDVAHDVRRQPAQGRQTAQIAQDVQDVQERVSEKGRSRDPRTVNALMEALKDTDKDVRETAMNALVQMRDPRLFDPLVAALKDSSADVREHAAFGLGQLRDVRAIEPLASAIKDQSASVREQVVFALGQLRAVGAIDPLTTALHDTSGDVREQAAFALGQIRDRRAVEPLISALKDEKPDVREQAAFALGQLRDGRAIEALVVALKDSAADVREQAAFALGQIGDARAIDGLTAALKDASASVRQQAAFALGQIR